MININKRDKSLLISYNVRIYCHKTGTFLGEDKFHIYQEEIDGHVELVKYVTNYPSMDNVSFSYKQNGNILDSQTVKRSDGKILKGQEIIDEYNLYNKFASGQETHNTTLKERNWDIETIFFPYLRDAKIAIIVD